MLKQPYIVEVCVSRVADAVLAVEAGADRIELNTALELDGLTPSLGLCIETRVAINVPIIAMLRPHHDGFVYDQSDRNVIIRDAESLLESGMNGIAFGALLDNGQLDLDSIREIRRLCDRKELVVHRAFDGLTNQVESLRVLIDLGVDRVLTSGGAPSAVEGLQQLSLLQTAAAGRIEILPAGGISHHNALGILEATGCSQIHGSFKQTGQKSIRPDRESIELTKQRLRSLTASNARNR